VRQSICRALADLSKVIRLPVHLHELLMKIQKEERQYHMQHGRWPTDTHVAKTLNIPVEKLKMIKQAAQDPKSMEDPVSANDPESASLGELMQDDSQPEIQVTLIEKSMQQDIDAVLSTLTKREYGILRMRYGLDDGKPKTLEEIGNAFHVTRERIRQIENKALAKLKDPMRHTSLKPYSDGEAMSLTSSIGWRQGINRNSSQ
jgi:RNA polymerase primary sigma factor